MGDSSACLVRSFSHPSSSIRESQEGDPLRALTESISFGRFASESLAWEKWSAFSHNRYLEEVEQCAKPGSVAAKKAFFEAHYKKRAALKAAALLEQAKPDTVNSVEIESGILKIDSPKLEMVVENVDEMMGEGTPIKESMELQSNKRRKSSASSAGRSSETRTKTKSGMSRSAAFADKQTARVVSPKLELDYSPKLEPVVTESEMQVENESMELQSYKRRKSSASSAGRSRERATKTTAEMSKSAAAADKQTATVVSPKLETVVTESEVQTDQERMQESNKRRKSSMSSAGRTETTRTSMSKSAAAKQTAASSSQTKIKTVKKVAEDTPVGRKRLAPKAVHMSINFASRLWETGKSSLRKSKEHGTGLKSAAVTKASVQGESLKIRASVAAIKASGHGKSEIRSSIAATKKSVQGESKIRASIAAATKKSVQGESKIRASTAAATKAFVQGESKIRALTAAGQADTKASFQGESKIRASTAAGQAATKASVQGESKIRASMAAATKASAQGESKIRASMAAGQVDSKSAMESSGMSGSKARLPLVLSPFSFRSEERAARRKEIMEERNKAKDSENLQMQGKSKEKSELHSKILRQSTATSRTKPDDDSSCRTQSVANHTRKSQVPLTRPRSPKLGRKPSVSSGANMEAKCRSSVRASVITDISSSKRVVPKRTIQSTNRSSTTLLPKRKTQENASPNIQL
ncbi:Protein WVD2-like 7 [Linum grandiflorum]